MGFNPRPLLLTGESMEGGSATIFAAFQSTPVIANGRIGGKNADASSAQKFQSTPVIANGRIPGNHQDIPPGAAFQSTPVIANGRIGVGAKALR